MGYLPVTLLLTPPMDVFERIKKNLKEERKNVLMLQGPGDHRLAASGHGKPCPYDCSPKSPVTVAWASCPCSRAGSPCYRTC